MKRAARILTVTSFTAAAWIATNILAHNLLRDTHTGLVPDVLTYIGAAVGFWFAWTGRLARLFRKV